ncbi:MAG: sulfatase-like hydrolase/transferase, partial [Pseudomonadota bacterium]|nr:sulfatase-like hydrolase/transferase [Pseudomonadota bacterium]
MFSRFVPRSIRFLFSSVLLSLLIFLLLRIIFFYFNHDPDDAIPGRDLLRAFYLGAKFDLRLVLLIHLPLLLFAAFRFTNPYRSRVGRRLWFGWLLLSFAAVLLIYVLDFGYYAYLEMRLDASVMRFLRNPGTSAQMVIESYPVVWVALGIAAALLAYNGMIRDLYRRIELNNGDPVRWPVRIPVAVLALALILGGLWGKFSFYPLRWSEAFFSNHDFASSLALNPVLFLAQTFTHRNADYDIEQVRTDYALMADYLGVAKQDTETLNFTREQNAPQPHRLPGKPNVVLVILESFGYYKTGLSGNPLDPTPHFDQLAREGLLFDRFYTPHGGTARSVFTAVTGIPDIETIDTSSRNPLIVSQHTIVNDYDGYRKFYFLGGSANWGQIRGLLAHNIEGLEIYEEGSYSSPAIDVWGISDLDLFREAGQVL